MDARQERAQKLAIAILDAAAFRGVDYADVRIFLHDTQETIFMNAGVVEEPRFGVQSGVGIRVLHKGAWGFSSFPNLDRPIKMLNKDARKALAEAMQLAKEAARASGVRIVLAPIEKLKEEIFWEMPCEIDPFRISRGEKIAILSLADQAMARGSNRLSVRSADLKFWAQDKLFASWEKGVGYQFIFQKVQGGGLNLYVYAGEGQDIQCRSDGFGKNAGGGFEILRGIDIEHAGFSIAQEAEQLLFADECPQGVMDVILLPDQVCLHGHETVHGLEGDRLLGHEDTYIGGTFVSDPDTLSHIGTHQFGSEAMNLVADATLQGAYGTSGFDDEGVPAQKFFLVEQGILKNLLTSRETVPQLNRMLGREYFDASNGAMHAYSFSRTPLIRMTNISLLPGTESLQDLIGSVARGIILTGALSWSMSADRKNFDFGLEKGLLIQDGKIVKLVKNPGYTGSNLAFWKSLAGVAGKNEIEMLNIPNCGKGRPGQCRRLGHSSPPALFRNVRVYNRKGQQGGQSV
ncbi:MAG: TldD/PmbA family protein [Candidatus Spechtbacterales bacterium]